MKRSISTALILLSVFTAAPAFAFQYGDFQIWNTDKVDAKINDRLKFKAEQELRFGNNVSEF
ncbi:MAG: hypothetical protein P9L88_07640, partial [Candidatus Tantalella remota]|nr:hypothetical protein [Candidatus Tantalella remota]